MYYCGTFLWLKNFDGIILVYLYEKSYKLTKFFVKSKRRIEKKFLSEQMVDVHIDTEATKLENVNIPLVSKFLNS